MIFDGFKSKNVIKQFNKSILADSKSERLNSKKIKNVLLFVDKVLDQNIINSVHENLNVDDSNIQFLIFKSSVEKNENLESCITKKDFGVFGKLKKEELRKILKSPFDIVINYTVENEFVNAVIADVNSAFKVGLLDSYSKVYDMIIDVDKNDYATFNKELRKYLLILNKL